MSTTLALAASYGELMPFVTVGGAFIVAIIAIVSNAIRKTVTAKAREQSRREIAAYVAEGSMTAEEGAKLIDAGKSKLDRICS